MKTNEPFPAFDVRFSFLNDFIIELVEAYQAGKLASWRKLDSRVKKFFTCQRMKHMEELVPGWKRMASYSDGVTQTHVMCVFLGVFMLSEFRSLSFEEQNKKWAGKFYDSSLNI